MLVFLKGHVCRSFCPERGSRLHPLLHQLDETGDDRIGPDGRAHLLQLEHLPRHQDDPREDPEAQQAEGVGDEPGCHPHLHRHRVHNLPLAQDHAQRARVLHARQHAQMRIR